MSCFLLWLSTPLSDIVVALNGAEVEAYIPLLTANSCFAMFPKVLIELHMDMVYICSKLSSLCRTCLFGDFGTRKSRLQGQ